MIEKTALVVDDSRSARYAMRKLLETNGYAVDTAESAQDAYVYLQRRHPQVIFLDQQMPGTDGLEVLRALKRDPASSGISVVVCSSEDSDGFRETAHRAGALEVLPKPPDATQLTALLRRLQQTAPMASAAIIPRQHVVPEPDGKPSWGRPPVTDQQRPDAGSVAASRPPAAELSESVDLLRLRREIAALRAEIEALRRQIPPDTETLVDQLLPSLLQALEVPLRHHAQRASAQVLQHLGQRLQQEARSAAERSSAVDDADETR